MALMELTLPTGRPFTYADLEAMPNDSNRYEIIDGTLVVTPSPVTVHERAVVRLVMLLGPICPGGIEIFASLDVKLDDATVFEPDVFIARGRDLTEKNLPAAPLLTVEVLSPSTRSYDLLLKRAKYEQYGVESYWIVDPDEPSLTVLELAGAAYAEVAHVTGDEVFEATRPFPVRVCPAELVRPR